MEFLLCSLLPPRPPGARPSYATNLAVLAQASGAPFTIPQIGLVNLATGTVVEFQGFGFGYVNGLAVEPTTGIACTTTETDNSAEFYDLAAKTGFIVSLPLMGQYSATTVAVDSVHHLFLIAHPVPRSAGQIHIFDENGNLLGSVPQPVVGTWHHPDRAESYYPNGVCTAPCKSLVIAVVHLLN